MSKFKQKQEEREKIIFTAHQLRRVENQIKEDGSVEKFLIKQNAIRIVDGQWTIRRFDGLAKSLTKTALGHFFETDTPFTYWNEAIAELQKTQKKIEWAKWKENQQLDKIASTMTIDL